jgi:uncharacterized membrane protein
MTFQKNNFLSVSSFLALVMTPVLIAVLFLVQQSVIRHEMKEKLEEDALQTLRIVEKNITWIEKGKELLVDGKLFDVKFFKNTGGFVEVTGLFDEMELALQHTLIYLQNPLKDNKQKQEFIYQILIQQLAEKTTLPSADFSSIDIECTYNPALPDIGLRAPYLLLLANPPDNIG